VTGRMTDKMTGRMTDKMTGEPPATAGVIRLWRTGRRLAPDVEMLVPEQTLLGPRLRGPSQYSAPPAATPRRSRRRIRGQDLPCIRCRPAHAPQEGQAGRKNTKGKGTGGQDSHAPGR